jgi:hypothetical protein
VLLQFHSAIVKCNYTYATTQTRVIIMEGSTIHRTTQPAVVGGSNAEREKQHIPPSPSEKSSYSSTVSRGGRSGTGEVKETAHDVGEQVAKTAEKLYHTACDCCHNWRHYPKLLTVTVLLLSFLIGAGSMAMVGKTGMMGRGGNFISAHWDRNTADAHHALDVILDHLKHPELYETSTQGSKMVHKARGTITDFLKGILPSGWGGRKSSLRDYVDEDYLPRGAGRRSTGGGIYDQVSETVGDLTHGMRRGAERGVDMAKDTGYGITSKLGELADNVKNKFTGDHDYDYIESMKGRGGGRSSSSWGSRGGYDEEDDVNAATQKLKRVVRQADREL